MPRMIKLRANSNRFFRFGGTRAVSIVGQDVEDGRDRRWALWIERMGKGDVQALSALYDESSSVIFSLVLGITHDREAAEETLVAIYDHVRHEAARFDARRQKAIDWLITVARNFATDRRRTRPTQSSNTVQDQFGKKRQVANLALARLSDEQRSILEMTYLGGLTAGEVADVLELSTEYVKEQIVIAMEKLKTGSQNLNGVTIRFSSFA
jgi:RNA polymerase sigma-70 factor (ECF subfamily)